MTDMTDIARDLAAAYREAQPSARAAANDLIAALKASLAFGPNDPTDPTPWEFRGGRRYKREDYYRNDYGVNGAKYRLARWMMARAKAQGYDHVVSAQSVLSPQSSIVATLAEELGMACTLCYGASKAATAVRHPNVAIAARAGARFDFSCRVAYNATLQPHGARVARDLGAWQMPYAITPGPEDLEEALSVGGAQARNLPRGIRHLVIPFGSGNTASGILYGLDKYGTKDVEDILLVGIGPDRRDRRDWLDARLASVGARQIMAITRHVPLHPWFARYADAMPETLDGIVLHPTYEGKVARYLNQSIWGPWRKRDDSVGFWIVGGPA